MKLHPSALSYGLPYSTRPSLSLSTTSSPSPSQPPSYPCHVSIYQCPQYLSRSIICSTSPRLSSPPLHTFVYPLFIHLSSYTFIYIASIHVLLGRLSLLSLPLLFVQLILFIFYLLCFHCYYIFPSLSSFTVFFFLLCSLLFCYHLFLL